jgi:drug/metabolite transporter (DMT)-like permease
MSKATFFTRRHIVFICATLCCLLWGSAYPAIKNGYALLSIAPTDVAAQMLFAGYRFVLAGLVLLAVTAISGTSLGGLNPRQWGQITVLGLTQTALQYVFFYIGLSYATGVKASIMNATGTFFSVMLAHFLYHNDRLNQRKIIGCAVGFTGVVVVNFTGNLLNLDFTFLGEGFVVIAAFILAAASIYGKRISQSMDAMLMTGYQLTIGGVALILIGWLGGGELSGFTWTSGLLLVYLALLSSVAFTLWSALLKYNPVGMVTIFNFLVPIFGALLSAIFLNESILEWKNLLALGLVSLGIWLVTRPQHPFLK